MRAEKELLQLLIKYISTLNTGLCGLTDWLYWIKVISKEERVFIRNYIHLKRPNESDTKCHWWYGNFFKNNGPFFFKKGKKRIRKAWLKHLVSQL